MSLSKHIAFAIVAFFCLNGEAQVTPVVSGSNQYANGDASALISGGQYNEEAFNTGNNGVSNAQGLGLLNLLVPSTSATTEDVISFVSVNGTHLHSDLGKAFVGFTYNSLDYVLNPNPSSPGAYGYGNFCVDNRVALTATTEQNNGCRYNLAAYSESGLDLTGTPTQYLADNSITYFFGNGIHQAHTINELCYTDDDCGGVYLYAHVRAAALAGSSEGTVLHSLLGFEDQMSSGNIVTGGAGATSITTNVAGTLANSANIIFPSENIASGYITAFGGGFGTPGFVTTTDTHSVSAGYGYLTAACGTNTVADSPISVTCPFTTGMPTGGPYTISGFGSFFGASFTATGTGTSLVVTGVSGFISIGDQIAGTGVPAGTSIIAQVSGSTGGAGTYTTSVTTTASSASITTYGIVAVADIANFECATATVSGSNITFSLARTHPLGTPIYHGIGTCAKAIQGRGTNPAWTEADHFVPNYQVSGARTATTWDFVFPVKNAQNGEQHIPLYGPISESISNATQSGNTVTLSLGSGGAGYFNQYAPPSGTSICVSGNSNSAFNVCGLSNIAATDNNTLTYNVGSSASISGTGGIINVGTTANPAINGLGNYEIDCGALVTKIGGVTLSGNRVKGDGSLHIQQNNCTMAPGEVFIQPNNPAQSFQASREGWTAFTPNPLGANFLHQMIMTGPGWNLGEYFDLQSGDAGIQAFQGWGGDLLPRVFVNTQPGVGIGTFFNLHDAPISTPANGNLGGVFAHIGPFPIAPGSHAGSETQYDLFELDATAANNQVILRMDVLNNTLIFGGFNAKTQINNPLEVFGLVTVSAATGSGGLLLPIYSSLSIPPASSQPAGTQVLFIDSNTLTTGTCTGGGTHTMIAITDGSSTWTCH
jgi:hypothetical protein